MDRNDPSSWRGDRDIAGSGHRYAFVCGLHRSGTTLLAQCLALHPEISGFRDTGANQDEGQYLQTVLPHDQRFGGAGRFGFDPCAHQTEASSVNNARDAARLKSEWMRYWDASKQILLEKTPGNLLRMRLLDSLLPPSSFIIVTRHPIVTALATMKWTEGNIFSLIAHWVECHRIARADGAHVPRTLWLSYEAFAADPKRELARVCRFLDLAPLTATLPRISGQNDPYFDSWTKRFHGDDDRAVVVDLPTERTFITRVRDRLRRDARERTLPLHRRRENRRFFHDALDAIALYEPAVREFGYSLRELSRFPNFDDPPRSSRP